MNPPPEHRRSYAFGVGTALVASTLTLSIATVVEMLRVEDKLRKHQAIMEPLVDT